MKKKKKSAKKTPEKGKKPMTQTHAKEEKFEPTTLDQIWGDTGNTRYGTMNEEEYLDSLNEMNKSDLQAHASLFGLVPIADRQTLTKKLTAEFKRYVSGFKKPNTKAKNPLNVSKEAIKILKEGK